MSREMVDSGIPWIGDVPKEWKKIRIKHIFEIIGGNGFKDKYQGKESGDYPFYKTSDINGDCDYVSTSSNYVDADVVDIENYNIVPVSSIVVSKIGAAMRKNHRKITTCDCCIDNNLQALHPIRTIDDVKYLYYLLKVVNFEWFDNNGTIPSVNNAKLKDLYFPWVSLAEQQRIAEFLDRKCAEVDEMIALQEQIIEELKAYKQSVITEAVTKGLNPDVPMKDSGIEWIGEIPEHWEVRRLKYVAERHCQKVTDEVLPYIGLENIESFSENYIETDNEYDISQAQICSVGDVIFGKLRPYLGKARVIKSEQCCSSEFIVLRGGEAPSYLRHLMLSNWFIEIVNASTYGTKMPRANADFIMNMQVIVPPIIERKKIECYLNTKCTGIDNLISIKLSKIDSLKEYKKSIIYEYVTGKREIKD